MITQDQVAARKQAEFDALAARVAALESAPANQGGDLAALRAEISSLRARVDELETAATAPPFQPKTSSSSSSDSSVTAPTSAPTNPKAAKR